jgi:hypothetical protein
MVDQRESAEADYASAEITLTHRRQVVSLVPYRSRDYTGPI